MSRKTKILFGIDEIVCAAILAVTAALSHDPLKLLALAAVFSVAGVIFIFSAMKG